MHFLPHNHDLPPSDAPYLILTQATDEERLATWKLNGTIWAGRLSPEAYLRREEHLSNQTFTRDGGITFWILVDGRQKPDHRAVLASCETLRKRSLVVRRGPGGTGEVEESLSHGVASVFCNPEYRRRGYTQRMMQELAKRLDDWQQPDGRHSAFTVLFSDIGKEFYARAGWKPFPSSHISLPAQAAAKEVKGSSELRVIKAQDLPTLCAIDEAEIIKAGLIRESRPDDATVVALVPDKETIEWHHAREEFFAREMGREAPDAKGAYLHCKDGARVWCVWTRVFGETADQDVFNILRLAIEGEEDLRSADLTEEVDSGVAKHVSGDKSEAIAALLRAAQAEASRWGIQTVQLWNPTRTALLATRRIDPSIEIVQRESDSITSLRWHGGGDPGELQWLGNEKYGWC